jgi:hypothetical protein
MSYVGKQPQPKFLGQVDDLTVAGDANITGATDIDTSLNVDGTVTADGLTIDGGTTNRVASFISTDANALIEFADDTTTNRPAIGAEGNDMTFSTNGEKVRIDSSGNVGIGTTSPDGKMHLFSASAGTVTAANGGDELVLENSATVGMTFLCPNNSAANILFGDPDDNNVGSIQYGHDTNYMAFATNASEAMRIDSSGNVGIGTTTMDAPLNVNSGSGNLTLHLESTDASCNLTQADNSGSTNIASNGGSLIIITGGSGGTPGTGGSEAMRIDSSGKVLIGTTDTDPSNNTSGEGVAIHNDSIRVARTNGDSLLLNRMGTDGAITIFKKDGSTVGSIGCEGQHIHIIGSGSSPRGLKFVTNLYVRPCQSDGTVSDNQYDLGTSSARFNDAYIANGVTTTSDRNEKQDIEELSEAEQRVAVACKGLLRKFRWKSAVEEKGDDARIHFGIMAQDLKAAFEAEGLDAGRYAMFMYDEWWETYTDVPAVEAVDAVYETVVIPAITEERLVSEAVLDEEGNEIEAAVYETVVVEEETTEERLVSEAVEAREAYTRTDTYDTEEEAPEGAVKKDRMGVRYSELLAFIIAAL